MANKSWFAGILVVLCLALVGWRTLHHQSQEAEHWKSDPFYSLRNASYPSTFISRVHVELDSPNHWVTLEWQGPEAEKMPTSRLKSSPGSGLENNNCNDFAESNRFGSNCTPKGRFVVQGFSDALATHPYAKFVTWVHIPREVAFHSYPDVADYPASHGCIRMSEHDAQLMHNNTIAGKTVVEIGGEWRRGEAGQRIAAESGAEISAPKGPGQGDSYESDVVVDSAMTFEESLDGVSEACPAEILRKLTLVDVEYVSFDGRVHRGQIVADRRLEEDIRILFNVALQTRFPITSVVPLSAERLRDGAEWSDEKSMQANNTSGFCYRMIEGSSNLSNHAYGQAIDINPVQNPAIRRGVSAPRGASYTQLETGALTSDCALVQAFVALGWEWGGTWKNNPDYQHFEKRLD